MTNKTRLCLILTLLLSDLTASLALAEEGLRGSLSQISFDEAITQHKEKKKLEGANSSSPASAQGPTKLHPKQALSIPANSPEEYNTAITVPQYAIIRLDAQTGTVIPQAQKSEAKAKK